VFSIWTGGRDGSSRSHLETGISGPSADLAQPDEAELIEAQKFNEIMDMIGPRGRDEFLNCLVRDLSDLAESLDRAITAHDADEAQRKTHILIGLAGTVGAGPLRDMALALHRNAAAEVARGLTSRGAQTLAELDRLIRFFKGAAEPERLA
jgi:HPt (histidine-containing phosphotransfer) domain-containing protein